MGRHQPNLFPDQIREHGSHASSSSLLKFDYSRPSALRSQAILDSQLIDSSSYAICMVKEDSAATENFNKLLGHESCRCRPEREMAAPELRLQRSRRAQVGSANWRCSGRRDREIRRGIIEAVSKVLTLACRCSLLRGWRAVSHRAVPRCPSNYPLRHNLRARVMSTSCATTITPTTGVQPKCRHSNAGAIAPMLPPK